MHKYWLIVVLLLIGTVLASSHAEAAVEELNPYTLANILSKEMVDKGVVSAPVKLSGVTVLPGFPDSSIKIVSHYVVNNTAAMLFSSIKAYKARLAVFNPKSQDMYEVETLIRLAFKKYYDQALYAFYHYIPSLAAGVPSGSYEPGRPSGVKSMSIPAYPADVGLIKPKLLLVLIGPSDGTFASSPLIIYYFGFETTGVLYPDIYTRIAVVVAVVVDLSDTLYSGIYPSIIGYHAYGGGFSVGSSAPVMIVYGFIGFIASAVLMFTTIDEEYKYYLYIFILYATQIFTFLLILVASHTPVQLVFDLVIALGQWFIFIFLLWTIPYILLAYLYHSERELEPPGPGRAVAEGLLFAFLLIIVFLLSINPAGVVRYMVAMLGPDSVYLFIVFLSGITLLLGLLTGGLWAKLSKVKELTGRYPGLH